MDVFAFFVSTLQLPYTMPDLGYPGWTCDQNSMAPSTTVPTNVNAVKFADIKIVGALGDSLTAGNGAGGSPLSPATLTVEYRGLTFQIGGDKSLDEHVTIPNVLRKFNPDLFGYSKGYGPMFSSGNWKMAALNQAVAGATSKDLPEQARTLVKLIRYHPERINITEDWKLINIFIGGNDMCAFCDNNGTGEMTFKKNIVNAVQILKDNLPRTIVSLTGMLDMTMLRSIPKGNIFCEGFHALECPCTRKANFNEDALAYGSKLLQEAQQTIENSKMFEGQDDFAFVIQPFLNELKKPPMKSDGSVDHSWFAADCFHFSQLGDANAAKHLWNNIVQPVGSKDRSVNLSDPTIPLSCPDPECPFFRTIENSKNCGRYRHMFQ